MSRDGVDTVGVCGSNPHAPTRFIGLFRYFYPPPSFTAKFGTNNLPLLKHPLYKQSTKIEQVIEDAREVFRFVEQDSKYTLWPGDENLEPQRTIVSYKIEDDTLLVLSVQGGNA